MQANGKEFDKKVRPDDQKMLSELDFLNNVMATFVRNLYLLETAAIIDFRSSSKTYFSDIDEHHSSYRL